MRSPTPGASFKSAANETEAELLQIGVGMPLLLVDSVAYTSDYKPAYVGKQVISTEDYRFTI